MDVPAPVVAGAWVDQDAVRRAADPSAKCPEEVHGFLSAMDHDSLLEGDAQAPQVARRALLLQDAHQELPGHSRLDVDLEQAAAAPVVPAPVVVPPQAQAAARGLVSNE
jgi:hypothetical protein